MIGTPQGIGDGNQIFIDDNSDTISFYCYDSNSTANAIFYGIGAGNIARGIIQWDSSGHLDISEAIDLYPDGHAIFASGKTYLNSDGSISFDSGKIYTDGNGYMNLDSLNITGLGGLNVSHSTAFSDVVYIYSTLYGGSPNSYVNAYDGSSYASQNWVNAQGFLTNGGFYTPSFIDNGSGNIQQFNGGWCFNSDGSGYVANDNINWYSNGGIFFNNTTQGNGWSLNNNGSINFDNGYIVSDGNGTLTSNVFNNSDNTISLGNGKYQLGGNLSGGNGENGTQNYGFQSWYGWTTFGDWDTANNCTRIAVGDNNEGSNGVYFFGREKTTAFFNAYDGSGYIALDNITWDGIGNMSLNSINLNKGLTTTNINNISSPREGMTIYNVTLHTLCFYNGTNWQKVTSTNM